MRERMLENRLSVVEYDVKSQAEKIALLTAQRREWLTDQIRAFDIFFNYGVCTGESVSPSSRLPW